jgi:hypothetical protein
MSIDDFVKESGETYNEAIVDLSKTMLFVVVRLFNNLYTPVTQH